MVWSEEQGRMVNMAEQKADKDKVSLDSGLAEILKGYAKEDGFDFTGISYVTEKDKDGKTKKDKDGKPIFVIENGKPKAVAVEVSTAKVNSAISAYVTIAVKKLIAERTAKANNS